MPVNKTNVNVEIDPALTELTEFKPERVDQVKTPASGAPILFMKSIDIEKAADTQATGCGCCPNCKCDHGNMSKAVNAQGGINEKPDIDLAEHILQELAQLMQAEAAEMAVGAWDEAGDVQFLSEIASLVSCFRNHEMWGDEDDGDNYGIGKSVDEHSLFCKDVDEVFIKAHRKFSTADRKKYAAAGHALPDGSYPIPDADALRRAAILARSGHGDVAAAKKLIARRAKELGVPNPLADNDNKTSKSVPTQMDGYGSGAGKPGQDRGAKPDIPSADDPETDESEGGEHEPTPPGDSNGTEVVSKAVEEATAPLKDELNLVKEQLAKLMNTPIPGGPALTAPPASRRIRDREELLAKAARSEHLAEVIPEQDMKQYYRTVAAEARAAAAAIN